MKRNLYIFILSSLAPLALGANYSSPLIVAGDYVNVFFDGSSSLLWYSNVFFDDENEVEEWVLKVYPGLEANLSNQASGFDASIRANYEIQRFEELFDLNGEYVHVNAVSSYDGARLDLDASYSFDQQQTTTGQEGTQGSEFIQLDVTRARLQGTYTLSPKFSFSSSVNYNDREYKDRKDRLADVESYSIPVDLFYELTPKVDLSVGYEYSFEEVGISGVTDFHRESSFINVGARGNLLPKLSGFFRVGYRTVNPEGAERESDQTLGINAELTHYTTPKLKSSLRLQRGFGVGSEGQSVENTSARLEFDYTISGNFAANLYTELGYNDFQDGNDGQDFVNRSGFRLSYLPNQYWRFSTGYAYIENDSNRLGQGFVNHILDISASLRY